MNLKRLLYYVLFLLSLSFSAIAQTAVKMYVKPDTKLTVAGALYDSNNTVIEGTLQMKTGGQITGQAPIYTNTSKLMYNATANFTRGNEWSAAGIGTIHPTSGTPGYPYNVEVKGNTKLAMGGTAPNTERAIENQLIITDTSSELDMSLGNPMTQKLIVKGDISINGILRLSSAAGGDLAMYGDMMIHNGASLNPTSNLYAFNSNGRTLHLLKNGTQTIDHDIASIGTKRLDISYLKQNPMSGSNTFISKIPYTTISAPSGLTVIDTGTQNNIIDITNNTEFQIGSTQSNNIENTIDGNGSFKGYSTENTSSTAALLRLYGLGTNRIIRFLPDQNYIRSIASHGPNNRFIGTLGSNISLNNISSDTPSHILDADTYNITFYNVTPFGTSTIPTYIMLDRIKGSYIKHYLTNYTVNPTTINYGVMDKAKVRSDLSFIYNHSNKESTAYSIITVSDEKFYRNESITNYLEKFWEVYVVGFDSNNISFNATYNNVDVSGNETLMKSLIYNTNRDIWIKGADANTSTKILNIPNYTTSLESINGQSTIITAGDFNVSDANYIVRGGGTLIPDESIEVAEINNTILKTTKIGNSTYTAFNIINKGKESIVINSVSLDGISDITIYDYESLVGTTIAPGASRLLIIQFEPTKLAYMLKTRVTINTNSADNPVYWFDIASTGVNSNECQIYNMLEFPYYQNFENDFSEPEIIFTSMPPISPKGTTGYAEESDNGETPKAMGTKSLQIENGTVSLESNDLDTRKLFDTYFSFRLGSYGKIPNAGAMKDAIIDIYVSDDGGNSYSLEGQIIGGGNGKWDIDIIEDTHATIQYDGNNKVEEAKTFTHGVEEIHFPKGFNRIDITNLPQVANLRVKIVATPSANHVWSFDNFEVTGFKQKYKIWDGTNWKDNDNDVASPPNNTEIAIFAADYDTNIHGSVNSCACEIFNDVDVNIAEGHFLNIENHLLVDGTLGIKNSGSMVQRNDFAKNRGVLEMKRTTSPIHRFDYVYWSTPLKESANYLLGKNPADTNQAGLSPQTYFNKYHSWTESQEWDIINYGNQVMVPGKGYIIRAPQTALYGLDAAIPSSYNTYTATFMGEPNNGIIETPLFANQKFTLIGNPYASAIDPISFITDSDNTAAIDGTIYIWTHNSIDSNSSTSSFVYTADDYATFNLSGYTNPVNANPNLLIDDNYKIPAAQGFFVKSTTAGGKASFNNKMRVLSNNNTFFRPVNPTQPVENWQEIGKHRFWLNLKNAQNITHQTMIGYIQNATNDLDWGYDGILNSNSAIKIYSILIESNLSIQGRALPFNQQDIVPLGYEVPYAGTHSIEIDKTDGFFTTQNIFLEDLETNIIHDLKQHPYTFTSQAGTFENRFLIRYINPNTLSDDKEATWDNKVFAFANQDILTVKSSDLNIIEIEVFDILGKKLATKSNLNDKIYMFDNLLVNHQVLLLKIKLENGAIVKVKVIL